jgi:hypothetical protein
MGPNWLAYLVRALSAVPYIVAGIEQIHGDAVHGAAKKQMALEAIGLSAAVAPAIDPQHAQTIAAASQLASSTIDGVVAVMNASKASKAPTPLPMSIPGQVAAVMAVTAKAVAAAAAQPAPAGEVDADPAGIAPITELLQR